MDKTNNNFEKNIPQKTEFQSILNDKVLECKNYIINYKEDNEKDIDTLLIVISAYNWLQQNKENIVDEKDLLEKVELSFMILENIKLLTDSSNDFSIINKNLNDYLTQNQRLIKGNLNYDFDISLCLSLQNIKDKIIHNEAYLNFIKESLSKSKNRRNHGK